MAISYNSRYFQGFSCKNNSCLKVRKSFKRKELYQQCFVERAVKQQILTAAKTSLYWLNSLLVKFWPISTFKSEEVKLLAMCLLPLLHVLTAKKFTKNCDAGVEIAVLHLSKGLAIHMIPEWLSFWNEFVPSPCISLSLFTRYRNDISFPYKSILFSVRIKFSFWYEISFWYHKNWKRTFFAPVFGVLVAVTVLVA